MYTSTQQEGARLRGRCACGQVHYGVASGPIQVVACHCLLCRQLNGAPFSVYVVVRDKDLQITTGEAKQYRASARATKHFCTSCGTPLFNTNPTTYKGLAMLYVGTIENHQPHEPRLNIFCESKLAWVTLNTGSQSFSRSPDEA